MNTTPLFSLISALSAEAAKTNKQYAKIISRVAEEVAMQSPTQAAQIHAAAKRMIDGMALQHAETQRVLANGGQAMAPDTDLLRLIASEMICSLTGAQAAVLSAGRISGHYCGLDDVRTYCQRADREFLNALITAGPPGQAQGE